MSQTVEKKEHNMAVITVEVPAEEFEKAVEKAYQRNKKSISVPGFRKGKVPRQLIEKMYGKEIFFEDAANICVPDAWEKAYDECEEEIVSSPKIDIKQIEAGKPFIFTAEVALNPVAEIGKYKGVEIDKIDTEVTDEDVNKQIDKEREEQSRMIAVDREAKNGDQAIIDFEGFIDDVAFEGGKGENHALTLGSGSFIPGFEEQVEGHKAGDEFDVNVTFPEDYHAEQLKGKPAVFKCRLHEVKEKEVPALDEDFADDAGFDSVDAYKADVKKKLEERKAAEAKDKKETAVLDKLIEDAKMDIPDAMVETGARRSLDQFNQQLMMQGMSIQQYYQYTGLNEQAMIEQSKPQALRRIKCRLVMEAVANAEGIEATEEDYEKEVEDMAKSYNMKKEDVAELMRPQDKKAMMKDIKIKKALDFVLENAVEK
ncbi:MAG: trigger factor [Lachnospiraceae bacterium]|nr:trigger factor [Lachnospiraceae bacterium]